VITTSGVLVSLLFGLAAVVTGADAFEAPTPARVLLVIALVLFVVAAVLGILVNAPTDRYQEADTRDLRRLTDARYWEGRGPIGSRRAGEVRIRMLEAARVTNHTKALLLLGATIAEIAAVGVLAGAVADILLA